MNLLLAALLLAATTTAPPPAPLAVVFVDVAGAAPWTVARQDAALTDVEAALAWVAARGLDAPAGVEVLPALALAPDALATWEWLRDSPPYLTLYIVNNAGLPHLRLGPDGWAGAYIPPDRLLVLSDPAATPRQAVIAHELVHVLTGAPDWPAPCGAIDILCTPAEAYRLGTLGCLTLAHIQQPCARHYLPWVQR